MERHDGRGRLANQSMARRVKGSSVAILVVMIHLEIASADIGPNQTGWEAWSSRPSKHYVDEKGRISQPPPSKQDVYLIQGKLRHTVSTNDFTAFKVVLAREGCTSTPAPQHCRDLLHHGDNDGRSIYHVIAKLGFGGDWIERRDITGYVSPARLRQNSRSKSAPGGLVPSLLQECSSDATCPRISETCYCGVWQIPDRKICAQEGGWLGTAGDKEWEGQPLDVMCTSLLFQVYKFSMEVLGIKPDLKLRDVSGQTPLHEAALHGRVLTIRTMAVLTDFEIFEPDNTVQYFQPEGLLDDGGVLLGQRAKIVDMPDSDFVRARPLPRDWAFGWTMMNFVTLASADSALRQTVLTAMATAMEGGMPQIDKSSIIKTPNFGEGRARREGGKDSFNFDNPVSKGMTAMDYAAINGHESVVDYLAFLDKASFPLKKIGIAGLGFAQSNWREVPVQKAATIGHNGTVHKFVEKYGCSTVFGWKSEGGEMIIHNAVMGGHVEILKSLKASCPSEFLASKATKLGQNPNRFMWSEQTPCMLSEIIVTFINNAEFGKDRVEFPDGFVGYHRYTCTHNPSIQCLTDSDCELHFINDVTDINISHTTACDLSKGEKYDVYDLLHHFEACHLVCDGGQESSKRVCGPPPSKKLRDWLSGEWNNVEKRYTTIPREPSPPSMGLPPEWKGYRRDPFTWYDTCVSQNFRDAECGSL